MRHTTGEGRAKLGCTTHTHTHTHVTPPSTLEHHMQAPPCARRPKWEVQSITVTVKGRGFKLELERGGGGGEEEGTNLHHSQIRVKCRGTLKFIHAERKKTNRKRVCPISETTQEVGHALCGVSERGWEKERRGEGSSEREGEHCSAYSPPLVLKQQQEEREGVRERRRKRSTSKEAKRRAAVCIGSRGGKKMEL